jgi:uncharacterized protein (DUF1778 family)
MAVSRAKEARIDIRLSSDHKAALSKASALQGLSLSDFIITRSLDAANEVIRKHSVITLSPADLERFARAIEQDAEPNESLKKAAERYRLGKREATSEE